MTHEFDDFTPLQPEDEPQEAEKVPFAQKIKQLLKGSIAAAGTGLSLAALLSVLLGVFLPDIETVERLQAVCDALFVTAMILLVVGAFRLLSHWGAYDGLGHGIKSATGVFRKTKTESYYEYIENKKLQRKAREINFSFFLVGGLFLIAAIIVLIIYHSR